MAKTKTQEQTLKVESKVSDPSSFKVNPNESKEWSLSVSELTEKVVAFKDANGGQRPKVMRINSTTGENLNYVKVAESLGLKVYSNPSQEADLVLLALD